MRAVLGGGRSTQLRPHPEEAAFLGGRLEGWPQAGMCHIVSPCLIFVPPTISRSERPIPPLCQFGQAVPFSFNHRFLLGTRPSLNLTFCRNCVGNGFEMLRVNHRDRASRCRVAALEAGVVLCEPFFEGFS